MQAPILYSISTNDKAKGVQFLFNHIPTKTLVNVTLDGKTMARKRDVMEDQALYM